MHGSNVLSARTMAAAGDWDLEARWVVSGTAHCQILGEYSSHLSKEKGHLPDLRHENHRGWVWVVWRRWVPTEDPLKFGQL